MKVVILAGGYGTRISEESHLKPKPMIEIGGKPILWHIMKEYSYYGFDDFVICAGYKQYVIKEWFANYFLHNSDITFSYKGGVNRTIIHDQHCEPWDVTIVDTGLDTATGGRLKRIKDYIGNETFMLTYGDGVCDLDINDLLSFHKMNGKKATVTAVTDSQSRGVLDISGDRILFFREKNKEDDTRINGGYMVLEPAVFDYLYDYNMPLERAPMQQLALEGELCAYKYNGFWKCMDTKREMENLENMIKEGEAPWIKW